MEVFYSTFGFSEAFLKFNEVAFRYCRDATRPPLDLTHLTDLKPFVCDVDQLFIAAFPEGLRENADFVPDSHRIGSPRDGGWGGVARSDGTGTTLTG